MDFFSRTSARSVLFTGTALALQLGFNPGAHAQAVAATPPGQGTAPEVAAQDASDRSGLVEIVVTAQKREQRLQDVPVAVTALTASSLEANRVTNVGDLSSLAPNLTARAATGGAAIASFSMRGVTSYGVVPGSDKEVSIYLDGVYISSTRGSLFELPDIERLEVLRGPQGTLFGRNATAGAISITTRDPTGKFGMEQDFTVGNYNQFRSRTTIDFPKVGPFSGFVTYVHDERRGDIRNLGAGTQWDRTGPATNVGVQQSPQWLGGKDANSILVALRFAPTDNFNMTYKFDYSTNHFTESSAVIGVNTSPTTDPLIGPLLGALISSQPANGPYGPTILDPSGLRPQAVNNSWNTQDYTKNYGHNLTANLKLSDHMSLKNIAAYRYAFQTSASQIDGLGGLVLTQQALVPYATFVAFSSNSALATATPAAQAAAIGAYATALAPKVGQRFEVVASTSQAQGQQWSDELQFNYDAKLLTLTAGAVWFHSKDRGGGPPGMKNSFSFSTFPSTGRIPLGNEGTAYNQATSLAAYTQVELHLLPQLDAVGGVRITRDKKSGTFVGGGTYVPPAGLAVTDPQYYTGGSFTGQTFNSFNYTNTRPSYSFGLNYKPDREILVYGKYSNSFVSGGAIGNASAYPELIFKPEIASSWEAGLKSDLLDRRLRANLALFTVNYKDLQSTQGGLSIGHPEIPAVIITQGNERARGAELEVTALPLRGLTLAGSLGYTDIKFGSVNPILLKSVGASSSSGYLPTLVPKFTSDVSAQYTTAPLFDDAQLSFQIDANWRSKMRFDAAPQTAALGPPFSTSQYSPARWLVNTRIALSNIPVGGLKGEVAFWTRNLNNTRVPTYAQGYYPFLFAMNFEPARTLGLDLKVKY